MCRIDYSESWTILRSTQHRARKARICGECRRTIEPGETYECVVGVMDECIQTYRTCRHCLVAREWLRAACGGWIFTEVADELREHHDDEPQLRSPVLSALIAGMRGRWNGGTDPLPDADLIRASIPEMAHA